MKFNTYILIGVIIVVLVGLFFAVQPKSDSTSKPSNPTTSSNPSSEPSSGIQTITMTDKGFEPSSITVTKGTKIVFKNEDTKPRWPASAQHPTHTRYPGSNIQKCNSPEEMGIFDACRGIEPGKEYSFAFNDVGEWGYHDHLIPSMSGKITVVEEAAQTTTLKPNTFELVVEGNKLISGPSSIKVNQGDDVTLKITADAKEELHLHAYDNSVELEPGVQAELKFNAKTSGRFPFELENSKTELGVIEVQPK